MFWRLDCLQLQVKPTQELGTSSVDWAKLSRFYLKTETEPSLQNIVLNKNGMMDNFYKYSSCRSYPQKLALTSPTSGGRSVDIVCSWTKATELVS
jgi:hypothetical protein